MEAKNYDSLIEVFRGNLWEAELIKGLLNSAGVDAMVKDETPSAAMTAFYGGGSVCVLVNKEEEVYARKVVAERKV